MQLSPHFTLEELVFSETAVRLNIDNTAPPPAAVANLKKLATDVLEPLRALLGNQPLHISSGYRCLALNTALKSAPTSHHVVGGAADFTCASYGSPLKVAQAIAASNIPFGQLIHEFGSWVHISVLPVSNPAVNRIITIDRLGTRSGLLPVR